MNIFKNLIYFKTSPEFNRNVLNRINKKKKLYLYYYPFIYGFLTMISIVIFILSSFQIQYEYTPSLIFMVASTGIFIIAIFEIKKLWEKLNI